MRIYLAGLYAGGRNGLLATSENLEIARDAAEKYPWELESYHYIKKMKEAPNYYRSKKMTLFLDSGAFSMFTKGIKVDLAEFAGYIKKNQDVIHIASNLDEIGRNKEQESYNNQKTLEKYGAKIQPVHHARDDDKWLLKYMAEGYDYIFLGGMVPETTKYLRGWLDHIWSRYLTTKTGRPKIKIHGFGLTTLDLINRYPWYCMTDEHEVLTRQGWRGRSGVNVGSEVLSFNDGVAKWEQVLEVPVFDVTGAPVDEIDYRTFSARVTPNHRWRVIDREGKWHWRTTATLTDEFRIPRVAQEYLGPDKVYPDFLVEIMAWFWTEGTIKKRSKYKKDSVVIYQSLSANPAKVAMIRRALSSAGEAHCEVHSKRKSGAVEIGFELYGVVRDWILSVCIDNTKQIPLSFIWNLTRDQLKLFVHISVLGDGTRSQLKRREGFTLSQARSNNVEVFRIACLLAGIPTGRWKQNEAGAHGLSSSSVNWIYPKNKQHAKWNTVSYTGKLWCIRVPSGAFFTRCNGKIYVTGNSVDSTSWVLTGRFGSIYLDLPHRDLKITFSSDSPKRKSFDQHYETLDPVTQRAVRARVEELGYDVKLLQTHYGWRDHFNIAFFDRIQKRPDPVFILKEPSLF